MIRSIRGVIHGKTIEIEAAVDIADGQTVDVHITQPDEWRTAILRAAGILADVPEWDGIMEEIHAARKLDRPLPADLTE